MTDTAKTVLIVGGVAVGAFVLLRVLAPSPVVQPRGQTSTAGGLGSFVQGIAALGSLAGTFGSSFKNEGTYVTGIEPDVVGNQLINPITSKPLVYGTD